MSAMRSLTWLSAAAIAALLANGAFAADAAHGKQVFEECTACHSLEAGVHGVGPSLQGMFGRKAADLTDFRYSPAMKRSGITWDAKTLDAYLADPQNNIKGNRMPYSGMPDARDRDDLIEYLRAAAK